MEINPYPKKRRCVVPTPGEFERGVSIEHKKFAHPGGSRGFTFLEVIGALVIFMIGILAIAKMFGYSAQAIQSGGNRTRAVLLAQEKLEELRSLPHDQLLSGAGEADSSQEGGPTFRDRQGSIRRVWTVQKDYPDQGLILITVRAKWGGRGGLIKTVTLAALRIAPRGKGG